MRQVNSVTEYQIGELVHPKWVDQFINILPPLRHTEELIQLGEPYSFVGGKATFCTLKKTDAGWVYAGTCYPGETEHRG